jgi:hypothetical protein
MSQMVQMLTRSSIITPELTNPECRSNLGRPGSARRSA